MRSTSTPRAATRFAPRCATTSSSAPRPWASRAAASRSRATTSTPGCGDYEVGGYSRMLDFGPPTHNGNFIAEAILHDIYIADNVKRLRPLAPAAVGLRLGVRGRDEVRGLQRLRRRRLFKHNSAMDNAPWHPYPGESPRPFVGQIYVTLADSDERVRRIEGGLWYDLHAFAVDPQGWRDIAEIGCRSPAGPEPAPEPGGPPPAAGLLRREELLHPRHQGLTPLAGDRGLPRLERRHRRRGSYVDGASSKFSGRGLHRVASGRGSGCRSRPSAGAGGSSATQRPGRQLPIPAWHEQLEGWPIEVEAWEEGPATSVAGPGGRPGCGAARGPARGDLPQPFNPARHHPLHPRRAAAGHPVGPRPQRPARGDPAQRAPGAPAATPSGGTLRNGPRGSTCARLGGGGTGLPGEEDVLVR